LRVKDNNGRPSTKRQGMAAAIGHWEQDTQAVGWKTGGKGWSAARSSLFLNLPVTLLVVRA
jgi:hypothetical protein